MNNRKVRKELGQRKADEAFEDLQHQYNVLVKSIEGDGFNPEIFVAAILTAKHVLGSETDAEQIENKLE